MRKSGQFATAADTFDIEALINELDARGANSNVRQGDFRSVRRRSANETVPLFLQAA